VSPHDVFAALADFTPPDTSVDHYGNGALMTDFEAEVATLLGKPAAVFMPSGTMAQQIALRIHADHSGNSNVAFHPTCHLEMHEKHAYRELHQLNAIPVGNPDYLMTFDDLKAVKTPIGTLLIELPQREIGGMLPSWDDLTEMVAYAREQGMTLHLDGARLWESQPFYDRSYAEICDLFDTVYVSFYKTLNGISGAMLLGEPQLIDEAKVWQRRHGGNLYRMYPFVLAAKMGLDQHLPQMKVYYDKTVEIAAALSQLDDIEIKPAIPDCNRMFVYFRRDSQRLTDTVLDIASETQTLLFHRPRRSPIPAYAMTDMWIGNAALDLATDKIAALFADLMRRSANEN
jgi:threonine aldolase